MYILDRHCVPNVILQQRRVSYLDTIQDMRKYLGESWWGKNKKWKEEVDEELHIKQADRDVLMQTCLELKIVAGERHQGSGITKMLYYSSVPVVKLSSLAQPFISRRQVQYHSRADCKIKVHLGFQIIFSGEKEEEH